MENYAVSLEQPREKRLMASAPVLAITSGKGGVGKTNIAANLALCMAAAKKRVLLIDADISLGNLDLVMNIRSKYNISHVISGAKRLDEIVQTGPNGLQIICGASGLDRLADISEYEQRRLLDCLGGLQSQTDMIVIDTAAGISSAVIGFCLASDHVLVVTTPEAPAMTDAYGIIKVLIKRQYKGPISVVVNMARTEAEGKRTYERIAEVARKFLQADLYYAGVLLRDERLCAAVRSRKPVVMAYPKSQIASALGALAARLGGVGSGERPSGGGFFRKVVRWLN
jgi:flagellar biosynthesis protein FlhG